MQPASKPEANNAVSNRASFIRGNSVLVQIRPHNKATGAPYPRFPVKLNGFHALHAPFLKERRTRGLVQGCVQEIRGISLVFREMWDTTAFNLRTFEPKRTSRQSPGSGEGVFGNGAAICS